MATRRSKKASRKKKTSRPRGKSDSRSLFPFVGGLFVRTALALLFCLAALLLYFDWQMQQHFRLSQVSRSAQLYAQAPQLTPGSQVSPQAVLSLLVFRGYRRVDRLQGPGSYVFQNSRIDIHPNPVPGISSLPGPLRLEFSNDRLEEIKHHSDGTQLNRLLLEPEIIGTLQLGSHEDRIPLRLHQMPELLIKAVLTMEDRNFEQHHGVDIVAIARALFHNLIQGRTVQGGSTITQQLVKNLFLSPERSLSRKISEAFMAATLELRLSKSEILEHYLNSIFLGQSGNRAVHGFALASEYYFARPIKRLRADEIATLVGMIPAPSTYNPRRHPERALARRNLVLRTLAEVGLLESHRMQRLTGQPLTIAPHRSAGRSVFPSYVDYLHRQVRQYFSEEVLRNRGIRLYTTLNPDIQQIAQQTLSRTLNDIEADHDMPPGELQGAAVIVSVKSADILALVGGRQTGYAGFNRAIDAQRPIGSLVKPLVYLSALEQPRRYTLATTVPDKPLTLQDPGTGRPWTPENYDREYHGPVTILESLARSYNIPAVRVGMQVGLDAVADTMSRLGVRKTIPLYPSILLGTTEHSPLEIAQLYQSIANHGHRIPLRSISHITDQNNRLIARFPGSGVRVIQLGPAFLIDFALKEVVRSGTASRISHLFPSPLQLAGKTGTTDDYRDSWFVGYSGNLLTVVWVGRDDNQPTGLTGAGGAMRVWAAIMQSLPLTSARVTNPESVEFLNLDPATGLLARSQCTDSLSVPVMSRSRIRKSPPCN